MMDLENINDLVAEIRSSARREAQEAYERTLRRAEEQVEQVEGNRLAILRLNSAGIAINYAGKRSTSIYLGFFKNTKKGNAELAKMVKAIRLALGCRLEQTGKDVDSAEKKTVQFTLTPVDFPSVSIYFTRKLPPGAKCKIVRSRSSYASLVCEL